MDYAKLYKLLGDHSRLKVLATLLQEPSYVELLATKLSLHPSTVSFHLKKLEEMKLVSSYKEQYYTIYVAQIETLNFNVYEQLNQMNIEMQTEAMREQAYREKVLTTFLYDDGTIKQIPKQHKKRLIILEYLADKFPLNTPIKEQDINFKIMDYYEDFAWIRREFIMNRLFTRDNGIYTRIK